MECRPEDPDFERHLAYTRFFARHTVPVPALLTEDGENKRALFEDLGDTSLYAYLKLPRDHESVESMYRDVLRSLVTLHTTATAHVGECPLLEARIFDYDYLRWETTYFLDRFVTGLAKLPIENRTAVDEALHRLAQSVFAKPKVIIHRDFQCQNIMVHAGGPAIIDYQGARLAPPAYDIASVLWDPYYRLDDGMRERLLAYYLDEMKADQERTFDEQAFLDSLVACRLQRHMQALGAYGFLSVGEGQEVLPEARPRSAAAAQGGRGRGRQEYPGARSPDRGALRARRYAEAAAAFSLRFRRPVAPASPLGARSFFSDFLSLSVGTSGRSTSSSSTMGAASPRRTRVLMIRV